MGAPSSTFQPPPPTPPPPPSPPSESARGGDLAWPSPCACRAQSGRGSALQGPATAGGPSPVSDCRPAAGKSGSEPRCVMSHWRTEPKQAQSCDESGLITVQAYGHGLCVTMSHGSSQSRLTVDPAATVLLGFLIRVGVTQAEGSIRGLVLQLHCVYRHNTYCIVYSRARPAICIVYTDTIHIVLYIRGLVLQVVLCIHRLETCIACLRKAHRVLRGDSRPMRASESRLPLCSGTAATLNPEQCRGCPLGYNLSRGTRPGLCLHAVDSSIRVSDCQSRSHPSLQAGRARETDAGVCSARPNLVCEVCVIAARWRSVGSQCTAIVLKWCDIA